MITYNGDVYYLPGEKKIQMLEGCGYKFSEAIRKFFLDNSRYRILLAGTRFGKSMTSVLDVAPEIVYTILNDKFKPTQGWIAGETYKQTYKEFEYLLEILYVFAKKYNLSPPRAKNDNKRIEFYGDFDRCGKQRKAIIECRVTQKAHRQSLLSEEVDWIILGEAAKIMNLKLVMNKYLRGRIVTRRGKIIIPTTPSGINDLQYYIDLAKTMGEDVPLDRRWSLHGPYSSIEGMGISQVEFDEARRDMPEKEFREQFLGEVINFEGLIYDEFRPNINIKEPTSDIVFDRYYIGYDVGITKACSGIVVVGIDINNNFWILDETYKRLIPDDAVSYINTYREKYKTQNIVVDSCDQGAAIVLRRYAIPCIKAKKFNAKYKKLDYIMIINSLFHQNRIYVHPKCKNFIMELKNYCWAEKRGETGERTPRDKFDNLLDAFRYVVSTYNLIDLKKLKLNYTEQDIIEVKRGKISAYEQIQKISQTVKNRHRGKRNEFRI
jgi:hypothetical protein